MQEIAEFHHIHIELPFERILRRLGYRSKTTEISGNRKQELEGKAYEAFDIMHLSGRLRILLVEQIDENSVVLRDTPVFESRKLARFLNGSCRVAIACVTAGKEIMDEIQERVKNGQMADAALFDAVASEVVDDAVGWVLDNQRVQLRSHGEELDTRRYSAGYGDFDLSYQAVLYDLLRLDEMGIALTPNYILLPEKTVTALAGIKTLR